MDRQKRRRLETKRWEFSSREMMLCRRYRGIKRSFHGKCARTIFMHELRCIKTTKEWPQQTSEVFDASQLMNLKSFVRIFHGIMFSFHTYWYLFTFQFNVTKVLHVPKQQWFDTFVTQGGCRDLLSKHYWLRRSRAGSLLEQGLVIEFGPSLELFYLN